MSRRGDASQRISRERHLLAHCIAQETLYSLNMRLFDS